MTASHATGHTALKKTLFTRKNPQSHWVGDGFPVRNVFSYTDDEIHALSPFLMLDYAGPKHFPPNPGHRRGVGEHPHRGFETVTIVYSGEVEHRDSSGGGGTIQSDEVQWMTAASGLVHEEFHGPEFSKNGGLFELVQLWVNLPKKDKSAPPNYQGLTNDKIPTATLTQGKLRVIVGRYENLEGPAKTHTPMNVWDLRLQAGHHLELEVPAQTTTLLFVLKGKIRLADGTPLQAAELAALEKSGDKIGFEILEEATVLLLNGAPIDEPIVGYGPFVMNTEDEIRHAFLDYKTGKMGKLNKA